MKKIWLTIYNYILSSYMIMCISFFYRQYLEVSKINTSQQSNFAYFVKDNTVMIFLFSLVLICVLFSLFYIAEFLVFTTREETKIKRILGYTYKEIVWHYYLRFISSFLVVISIASIVMIPFLNYFSLPIIIPIVISYITMTLFLSIFIVVMLSYCLFRYKKGMIYELNYIKKFTMIVQFSISLMFVIVSIILLFSVNAEVSPYRNYAALTNSWSLVADVNFKESFEIEKNPEEYHTDLLNKIEKIYNDYEDNMLVYFSVQMINHQIGSVLQMNEKAWELNNLDSSIFTPFLDTGYIPIILINEFYGVYAVGDVIENGDIDYIVAKVLEADEEISALGPMEFVERTSEQYNFAWFDNKYISKELRVGNDNFLHTVSFYDIDIHTIQDINEYINQPNLKFKFLSISESQNTYYQTKMVTIAGYFGVGMIALIFSIMGLICAVYVDICSKEVNFSIMKITGYSNKEITIKYLFGLFLMIIISFINALLIAYLTLAFSALVTLIVSLMLIIIASAIAIVSYLIIKSIQPVEIIGGTNV